MSNKNSSLNDPVFKDTRGEIRRYELEGVKYNALFTKAGVMRSGDYHPARQFDAIISGRVKLTLRINEEDVVKEYGPGEFIVIEPDTPHLFEFPKDTVMIEWWDAPFEAKYYAPYRKLIEENISQ